MINNNNYVDFVPEGSTCPIFTKFTNIVTVGEKPKNNKENQNKYKYEYKRVTKFSEECVTLLGEAFAIGANVKMACYYANISRNTFYRWLKESPSLSDRFEDLRQKLPLQALHNISKGIDAGEIPLSERLLAKRFPKEYAETFKIQHVDDDGTGTPNEDREIIKEFHDKLKSNRLKRSRDKAKLDGEI